MLPVRIAGGTYYLLLGRVCMTYNYGTPFIFCNNSASQTGDCNESHIVEALAQSAPGILLEV